MDGMSIRGLASAAVVLAVTTLAACGGSPTAPDYLPGLVVQAETAAYTYRAAPGDSIDTAWQQTYHDWAVAALQITTTRRIVYNKYLNREHMGSITGRFNTNGFATNETFEMHTIWPMDNHEVVHLLTSTFGFPVALFNEGIAVAHQTNPSGNDFVAKWNGTPLHDHARTFRRTGRLIPLSLIVDSEAFRSRDAEITYPESGSFMRWLIDTHGLAKVKALFGRVAYPDPPAASRAAFLGVFGMMLEEAETQWLAFLGS
jgi:hypothetical protein